MLPMIYKLNLNIWVVLLKILEKRCEMFNTKYSLDYYVVGAGNQEFFNEFLDGEGEIIITAEE